MTTIILGFILLATVITIMSVGVLMGRKPISGSCGGVGAALGEKDYTCDLCGGDPKKCEEQNQTSSETSALAYDATLNNRENNEKDSL